MREGRGRSKDRAKHAAEEESKTGQRRTQKDHALHVAHGHTQAHLDVAILQGGIGADKDDVCERQNKGAGWDSAGCGMAQGWRDCVCRAGAGAVRVWSRQKPNVCPALCSGRSCARGQGKEREKETEPERGEDDEQSRGESITVLWDLTRALFIERGREREEETETDRGKDGERSRVESTTVAWDVTRAQVLHLQ